jgi:hypothetical protein
MRYLHCRRIPASLLGCARRLAHRGAVAGPAAARRARRRRLQRQRLRHRRTARPLRAAIGGDRPFWKCVLGVRVAAGHRRRAHTAAAASGGCGGSGGGGRRWQGRGVGGGRFGPGSIWLGKRAHAAGGAQARQACHGGLCSALPGEQSAWHNIRCASTFLAAVGDWTANFNACAHDNMCRCCGMAPLCTQMSCVLRVVLVRGVDTLSTCWGSAYPSESKLCSHCTGFRNYSDCSTVS